MTLDNKIIIIIRKILKKQEKNKGCNMAIYTSSAVLVQHTCQSSTVIAVIIVCLQFISQCAGHAAPNIPAMKKHVQNKCKWKLDTLTHNNPIQLINRIPRLYTLLSSMISD